MAKTININGTATQMVSDINANFDELYEGAGACVEVKDHTETLTSAEVVLIDGKNQQMSVVEGILVLSNSSSNSRKTFRIPISNDSDAVIYNVNSAQSDSGCLAYAIVDENMEVLAYASGSTSTKSYAVFKKLTNAMWVYVSTAGSASSASIDVMVFGDTTSVDAGVRVSATNKLTMFYRKAISVDGENNFGLTDNSYVSTFISYIGGCRTIEGYGYNNGANVNFAVLDKDLKVIMYDSSGASAGSYKSLSPFAHIPEGAKFLAFIDTQNASYYESEYVLSTTLPKKEFNVLVLGNSYTYNYFDYVPAILESLYGDKCRFNIIVGMVAMSSFQDTWYPWLSSGSNGMAAFVDGKWRSFGSKSASSLFGKYEFDVVGFQQVSGSSHNYNSWKGTWPQAVAKVCALAKRHTDVMWTMTHAKPTGGDLNYTDNLMRNIIEANKSMSEDFPVDICPVGTAIQNARHTDINNLQWVGTSDAGQLTLDGSHLQLGFACYIAGLVVARYLGKKAGIDNQCLGDKLHIDAEFDANYTQLDQSGSSVYSTDEDMDYLAQRCVESALKFPFEIKDVDTGATITT